MNIILSMAIGFDEYQKKSSATAVYPNIGHNFVYPTLGLADESGEVVGKIKKVIRDDGGVVGEEKKEDIKKEMGDVLWYLSQLATELGIKLSDVAQANIDKLASRMERGKLQGSGDNR
jgi:NTP pyrophosphatase (non-canonical NTP hydrolase)